MKKKLFIYFLSLILVSSLFGVQKNAQPKNNKKVMLTGYVISKGNMPFIFPVIQTTEGTEYLIVCSEKTKQKLLNAQGHLIKFTGKFEEDAFVLKKWKVLK